VFGFSIITIMALNITMALDSQVIKEQVIGQTNLFTLVK